MSIDLKIPDLIINLIASALYDVSKGRMNKIKFWQFKSKEKKWLERICIKNDGTILVSSHFERFLKYHQPIERIFSFILDTEYSNFSEDEFIANIIEEFKSNIQPGKSLSILDEKLISNLFIELLQHLKQYMKNTLTDGELYSLYVQKQGRNRTDNLIKEQGSAFLEKLGEIANCSKISDKKTEEFYQSINKTLLQGQIEIIYKLIPLIENKNDDLENSVKINLEIISDYHILSCDILNCYSKIKNDNIKNDICRKLILYFRENLTSLEKLRNTTTNNELNEIIEKLINHHCFYTEKIENENHVTFYNFTISKDYKNEQELINRLCFFDIYNKRISEVSGVLSLLKPDEFFIDKLFELESKHLKLLTNLEVGKKNIALLCDELVNLENLFIHATPKLKNKYYEILIRTLLIIDNQRVLELAQKLPSEVSKDTIISSLIMSARIKNNSVTEEEVVDFCYKTEQYTLINNYILEQKLENNKIKDLLYKNIHFVKKEFLIFIIYAQVIMSLDGNTAVQRLKDEYANEYKHYLEYHLLTLDLTDKETYENDLNNTFKLWSNEKIRCYYRDSEIEFIRILLSNRKISEAWDVLSKQETMKYTNSMLPKYKAKLLLENHKFIDALSVLVDNFELYKEDIETIDIIITLSLQNSREINPNIIEQALKFRTPRILSLVANVYVQGKKYNEAKCLMKEALLKSPDAMDMCEGYLYIHMQSPSKELEIIKSTDVDTVIILKNDKTSVAYCIHKNNFLDTEPYMWENSVHISEDTAIRMKMLNKKVGCQICVENTNYNIDEILPIDAFLTRCCMEAMIKKGTAKAFHAEIKENTFVNIDEFKLWIKENTGDNEILSKFIEKYKDMSQIAIPLFMIQKIARPSYSELIIAFLEDKNIIFRDSVCYGHPTENGYILTTSAIIALYKIGVDIQLLNTNNVYIPESMHKQIQQDIEECIRQNKSEHNTTMGVMDDQIFVHELSEDEKQKNLLDAVNLRKFIEGIQKKRNNANVLKENTSEVSYQETLGISDYDSFSIALAEKHKFVSAESSLLGLATYYEINSSCILDFLCEINTPLLDLIKYMKNMLKFKFLVVFSPCSMDYITKNFFTLSPEEQKTFLKEWDEYLKSIQAQDEKYKEICISLLNKVFGIQYENKENILNNPVLRITMPHILDLNNLKIELQITEDGEIKTKIYKVNNPSDTIL